jgi:HD-GYP domain-containing protein (c-di-GMP phosphodiesterase class II)
MWKPGQQLADNEELISADQLEVGMVVIRLDIPWDKTPFVLQGFKLTHPEQVTSLKNLCKQIVILDKFKRDDSEVNHAIGKAANKKSVKRERFNPEPDPLNARSLRQSRAFYARAYKELEILHELFAQREMPSLARTNMLVKSCLDQLLSHSPALMWMTRIRQKDRYTVEHSLNVGILSMALGLQLGLDGQALRQIGLAGILHDLGKLFIDDDILNKSGPLSPEEFKAIRQHPEMGFELLQNDTTLDWQVIDAVLHHHERIDGKGYPHELDSSQIQLFAKVVAITDAFDAMTTQRTYNVRRTNQEALSVLYNCKGTQFDQDLVNTFIEVIGIYPEGTLVELNTGEVGVVVATHPFTRLHPVVTMLLDSDHKPYKRQVTRKLTNYIDEDGNYQLFIKRALVDGTYNIYLKDLLQEI